MADLITITRQQYLEDIRSAMATGWDEGYGDGIRQDAEGDDGPRFVNPYREEQA